MANSVNETSAGHKSDVTSVGFPVAREDNRKQAKQQEENFFMQKLFEKKKKKCRIIEQHVG